MNHSFYLATRYLWFYRWRTLFIICGIALTAFMPLLLAILLTEFDQRIARRAASTPWIVGSPGSGVDLTLHGLYFTKPPALGINFGEFEKVQATGLAEAIPLNVNATVRDFPVVGTNLAYFRFRGLEPAQGRLPAMLGECVVGWDVAASLGLTPGSKIMTDRENLVDIAGLYPLRLPVVGVLRRTKTADDRAVFVDVKTTWVIAGLGHGHEDLTLATDPEKLLSQSPEKVVASAAVLPFTEITPDNLESLHFHGEPATFPLTALLVIPNDKKSETLWLGRIQGPQWGTQPQVWQPSSVIRQLMGLVFQVSQVFQLSMGLVGISTVLLLSIIAALSLKLRAREMETMFRLGCSRSTIRNLQIAEITLVMGTAFGLAAILIAAAYPVAGRLLERLIVG